MKLNQLLLAATLAGAIGAPYDVRSSGQKRDAEDDAFAAVQVTH